MITDKMVEAARDAFGRSFYDGTNNVPDENRAWRAALEAAGVGELIEALKPFAVRMNPSWNGIGSEVDDYRRARAVLEKLGVKL